MEPGQACIACHNTNDGPGFGLAGTIYPSGHEPDNCNGATVTTDDIVIEITDATGQVIQLSPNTAGNFYSDFVQTPYTVRVTYQGRERRMNTPQTDGDCNGCHTQDGANSAPGRITLP
jgi:hypothetical protein